MENPNVKVLRCHKPAVNLRRHTSLPGPLRSIRSPSASRRISPQRSHELCKLNPYVGWFRHAPSSNALRFNGAAALLQKKRRYIAKGHILNTPASSSARTLLHLQHVLKEQALKKQDILDILKKRGHLRGGAKYDLNFLPENESITAKALSRIACWLLYLPIDGSSSQPPKYLEGQMDAASVVSEDESTEYDNYDTTYGSRQRSDSFDSSTVLSSQAEAYYALHTVHDSLYDERSSSTPTDGDISSSRLDYDITQMDIVRMNRVASRHLDVESIVRLPVRTYGTDEPSDRAILRTLSSSDKDETTGFSWMLIAKDDEATSSQCSTSCKALTPAPKQNDLTCVICLEHFVRGDRLRVLPCSHSFHVGCIDRWLSGSHSFNDCFTSGCPTCKKNPSVNLLEESSGSVPSWAFERIGDALASRDTVHF